MQLPRDKGQRMSLRFNGADIVVNKKWVQIKKRALTNSQILNSYRQFNQIANLLHFLQYSQRQKAQFFPISSPFWTMMAMDIDAGGAYRNLLCIMLTGGFETLFLLMG
jgi:hypothetical protein